MEFKVEKAVLDAGVKIVFVVIQGLDNSKESYEWHAHREILLNDLLERYKDIDVHQDPILEGFNLLHDHTGVKRRKNTPCGDKFLKACIPQ